MAQKELITDTLLLVRSTILEKSAPERTRQTTTILFSALTPVNLIRSMAHRMKYSHEAQ